MTVNVPLEQYASLLPSIYDLVTRYHVDPETAFYFSRPVLPLIYVTASFSNFSHWLGRCKRHTTFNTTRSSSRTNGNISLSKISPSILGSWIYPTQCRSTFYSDCCTYKQEPFTHCRVLVPKPFPLSSSTSHYFLVSFSLWYLCSQR